MRIERFKRAAGEGNRQSLALRANTHRKQRVEQRCGLKYFESLVSVRKAAWAFCAPNDVDNA